MVDDEGMRCASMARRIVAASGQNVFDDYFTFYQDGKWLVEIVRRLKGVVSKMEERPSDAVKLMPKAMECVGYINDVKLDEMGTSDAKKRIEGMVSDLRKAADASDMEGVSNAAAEFRDYLKSYETSCSDAMKIRYADDEADVSGLLETIRDAGNYVFNQQ